MQFSREDFRTTIATIPCICGSKGATATAETDGPHFMRLTCNGCGRFLDWISWPVERPSDHKRRRQRITKLGEDRCELCLRSRFELPVPQTLQEHHVIEHAEGGSDEPDNTRVYCTACHAKILWLRTYFGHYHPSVEAA